MIKYKKICFDIEREIPLFNKVKYFQIFEKLISMNDYYLLNENEKEQKLIFDISIKKIEINWKTIYDKLYLKDKELNIPLIISKYLKSKAKMLKLFIKNFSKKYNLTKEITRKLYFYICKKKYFLNPNSNEILKITKEIEKENLESNIKYHSTLTNIFIEYYNKKKTYDEKEFEEEYQFNKKYFIKKNIRQKAKSTININSNKNKKFKIKINPSSISFRIKKENYKKNLYIQSYNSKNNSSIISTETKNLKKNNIKYNSINFKPIKLKKLKKKINHKNSDFDLSKIKFPVLYNKRILKEEIEKKNNINKSTITKIPINFFSKKDLTYY